MDRCRRIWLSWWLAPVLVACPGCLFTHHSQHVIREKETPRPVHFESERAQTAFNEGVANGKARERSDKGQFFAIPFLLWFQREEKLSDAAWYNDQVAACDTNRDGLITTQEALAYRARLPSDTAADSKPGQAEAQPDVRTASGQQPLDAPLPAGVPR